MLAREAQHVYSPTRPSGDFALPRRITVQSEDCVVAAMRSSLGSRVLFLPVPTETGLISCMCLPR